MDSKETRNIWIVVVVIALIAGAYYFGTNQKGTSSLPVEQNVQDTASQKSEHIASYISTLNKVFYSLYRSTLEYSEVQSQYPTFSQDTLNSTAGLQISQDLTNASIMLKPYIEDKDEGIKATATLLYADIVNYLNVNSTVTQLSRNVSPDNIQELKFQVSNLANAQNTIKKDIFSPSVGLMLVITKGIIQIPTDKPTLTGTINYSVSKDQRLQLLDEINRMFGDSVNNSKDNVYLLAERVLQLSLTPDTYEEQKTLKI